MRANAPLLLALLASCGGAEANAPATPAPTRPALAPLSIQHVRRVGDPAAPTALAVVLTRAVAPTPEAFALTTSRGRRVKATTTWLDRQLVALYPDEPLPPGQELRLSLEVPLRASDGAPLGPRVIERFETPPIKTVSFRPAGGVLFPMGELELETEEPVPPADIEALASVGWRGGSIAVHARAEGGRVRLRPDAPWPVDQDVNVAWQGGATSVTSIGRVALHVLRVRVRSAPFARVGEPGEGCSQRGDRVRCTSDRATLVLAAPISDASLARHVHPALTRRVEGDTRGHRFEVPLASGRPVKVTLDKDLTDTLGRRLGTTWSVIVSRAD